MNDPHALDIPILEDEVMLLKPFEGSDDFDYLVDLAMKYRFTEITEEQARSVVREAATLAWTGYIKETGMKSGVVYLCNNHKHGVWTIDGYRDDPVVKLLRNVFAADYSYHAARLVMNYAFDNLTDKLAAIHNVKNRPATALMRRLGFTVVHESVETPGGSFIVMSKEVGYGS